MAQVSEISWGKSLVWVLCFSVVISSGFPKGMISDVRGPVLQTGT